LGNALKFTKTGHIKFGYKLLNEKLQFYVQDTGIGISKENQLLVFERFRQEEETYTRQFGGTGLGLTISKKLAELLGGEMWMISEQGAGSTFFFTIPYVPSFNTPLKKEISV
jgi:signal transduction histidine kinase